MVGEYLFADAIVEGVKNTLTLTAIAVGIGLVLGVAATIARLSDSKVTFGIATAYVWFFRGTPLLVQLLFWFFLSALLPTITLGLPFGGPSAGTVDTNTLIIPFLAAIAGLRVNEGAYMAEIVRSGILSISKGQTEPRGAPRP